MKRDSKQSSLRKYPVISCKQYIPNSYFSRECKRNVDVFCLIKMILSRNENLMSNKGHNSDMS